jgi:cytochrome b involved in lipid metabolism
MLLIIILLLFLILWLLNRGNNHILLNTNSENKNLNTCSDIIVTYKGSKYDISDFIKKHPGGKQILIEQNGHDIEKKMIETEHSPIAYKILEKYKVNGN